MNQTVLVGDRVQVSNVEWINGRGVVEQVFERTNELLKPSIANIDQVVLVFSLSMPQFEPVQATKFLIAAEGIGIPIAVVLNKSDLIPPDDMQQNLNLLKHWGYKAIPASVMTGDGLNEMKKLLGGKVSVLCGPSGVGKSSIINALRTGALAERQMNAFYVVEPDEDMDEVQVQQLQQQQEEITEELIEVQFVSDMTGKGRHTTRNVALFSLPENDGVLADTPGFNQPILDQVTLQKLPNCFPEINNLLKSSGKSCRFRDCKHLQEPGCVVRDRFDRYEYYVNLHDELAERDKSQLELQLEKKKREGKTKTKVGKQGQIRQEVYLDPKQYRRESRQAKKKKIGQEYDQDEDIDEEHW